MAKKASSAGIHERLYNLALSVDYDQPSSLEGDLDFLADGLIADGFCSEDFEPTTKDGYLGEVLRSISDPQEKLGSAIKASDDIDDILGRMDYGQLGKDDAGELEDHLQTLIGELEVFLK